MWLGRLAWASLLCAVVGLAQAADGLVVLLSEASPAHNEVSDALRAELPQAGGHIDIDVGTDLASLLRTAPRLIVTVGTSAFQAAASTDLRTPILAVLLPRSAYERIVEQAGRRATRPLSAVFLDQPVARQLDLIRVALPEKRRIGIVFGPESQSLAAALQSAAQERELRLSTSRVGSAEDIFPALQRIVGDAELLLAEPDPLVYNSATIQNILLTSYRAQIPLIGFSPAYIRAGALLALFTTPSQVGTQAGEITRAWFSGKGLPPPQAPREFSVAVNPHVARSLGLRLDEPAAIGDKLRQMERRP
jgi:putative ABC transport system substrate-binding protein